jgi:3D (Asp-Asp-Asp) domain-containing protein
MVMLATVSVAARHHPQEKTETRVETKEIPFRTSYEVSRTVTAGRTKTETPGKPGEVIYTYAVNFKLGKPVSKTLVSTEKVEPVDEVILIGKPGIETSRHKFYRGRILTMDATAYDARSAGGSRTCSGLPAKFGAIAVDPRVIPMGTMLYVEGYGLGVAADRGSAIKGKRLDLCFDSRAQALHFGRHSVKVHVLTAK